MMESKRITVATAWLDGCSGCHMSLLDIDERLFALAKKVDIIYGPLVDAKTLPESVDVGILEGSVSTDEDLKKAREFRRHCKFLISLGDCAVCGNVPAMRNFFPLQDVLDRAYQGERAEESPDPDRGRPDAVDHGPAGAWSRRCGSVRAGLPATGRRDLVCVERTD